MLNDIVLGAFRGAVKVDHVGVVGEGLGGAPLGATLLGKSSSGCRGNGCRGSGYRSEGTSLMLSVALRNLVHLINRFKCGRLGLFKNTAVTVTVIVQFGGYLVTQPCDNLVTQP